MATNFPNSVDSLTNPTTSDTLASVSHSAQHADANDAIEAIQTALLDGAPLKIDDANQRVGIGTASPAGTLDVNGKIHLAGGTDRYVEYRSGNNDILYSSDAGDFYRQDIANSSHQFFTGNAERMKIDQNGFVGIGMTPTLPLDVEGRGRFVSPNVGSTGAVIVRQPAGDVDGGYIQWVNNANTAQMGTIYVSNSGSFAISPSSGTINLAGSNLQKNGTTFYGVGYADISFTVSSTTTAAWYMLSMPSGVSIYNLIGFTPLEGVNNTLTVYYYRVGVWSGVQTASQLYLHCSLGNSVHTNPYYIRFYYRI